MGGAGATRANRHQCKRAMRPFLDALNRVLPKSSRQKEKLALDVLAVSLGLRVGLLLDTALLEEKVARRLAAELFKINSGLVVLHDEPSAQTFIANRGLLSARVEDVLAPKSLVKFVDVGVTPSILVAFAGVILDYPIIYCFGNAPEEDATSSPPNCLGGLELKLFTVTIDRKDGSPSYILPHAFAVVADPADDLPIDRDTLLAFSAPAMLAIVLDFERIRLELQEGISRRLEGAEGNHPWVVGSVRVALEDAAPMDRFAL
ncbi:hypothetical protein RQP46_000145 [Phenoliferia psychrophenolica]